MASKKCFKHNCDLEVKYICKCSDFETFSCDLHFEKHLKLNNRKHRFEPISIQPGEEIKGHQNEKSNKEKKNIVASKSKDQYKTCLKRRKVKYGPEECIYVAQDYNNSKIKPESNTLDLKNDKVIENSSGCKLTNETLKSKALNEEIGLNHKKQTLLDFQLSLDISKKWDIESIKKEYSKTPLNSLSSQDITEKISMLLSEGNNPKAEQDFRRIRSFYKNKSILDPALKQLYKEYISIYHKITSLYHFESTNRGTNKLIIYDTESERERVEIIETPARLNDEPHALLNFQMVNYFAMVASRLMKLH